MGVHNQQPKTIKEIDKLVFTFVQAMLMKTNEYSLLAAIVPLYQEEYSSLQDYFEQTQTITQTTVNTERFLRERLKRIKTILVEDETTTSIHHFLMLLEARVEDYHAESDEHSRMQYKRFYNMLKYCMEHANESPEIIDERIKRYFDTRYYVMVKDHAPLDSVKDPQSSHDSSIKGHHILLGLGALLLITGIGILPLSLPFAIASIALSVLMLLPATILSLAPKMQGLEQIREKEDAIFKATLEMASGKPLNTEPAANTSKPSLSPSGFFQPSDPVASTKCMEMKLGI